MNRKFLLPIILLVLVVLISIIYYQGSEMPNDEVYPTISINTKSDALSKDCMIPATISLDSANGFTATDLGAQIRLRGNSTVDAPKKSYQIKMNEKINLFGIGEGKSKNWVLLANFYDLSKMRNKVSLDMARHLSNIEWSPNSMFVNVQMNGEDIGIYLLTEKVENGKHRIDIESGNVNDDVDIGYLVEMTHYSDDYTFYVGDDKYSIKSDLSENEAVREQQLRYIEEYLIKCTEALQAHDMNSIEEYINIDSLVDYYLLEETTKNLDVGWDSFYLYKKKSGKLYFGPAWDFDLAWGQSYEMNCKEIPGLFAGSDELYDETHEVLWFYEMLKNREYREKVQKRWNEISPKTLSVALDDIDNVNCKSLAEDAVKWNGKSTDMSGYVKDENDYSAQLGYLKQWVESRFDWLNDCFNSGTFLGDDYQTLFHDCGVVCIE